MIGRAGRERGAALVIVLLAVTLLMLVVVEFTYSTQVDTHLAYNGLRVLQASCLAHSGVNLARLALANDAKTSGLDSLGESWAHTLPPLPVGEGVVAVRVTDEQGKVNVNTLRNTNGTISGPWQEITARLLTLRGIDVALLDPLLDWLDRDDFPKPYGAEKPFYLSQTPPYTPRNGPLLTLGELGRIHGLTAALRARLGDVLTVLPNNRTQINVNTAPADVLRALFPRLDPDTLDRFLDSREEAPVRGTSDLLDRLGMSRRTRAQTLRFVTVRSEFFSITTMATVDPVSHVLTVVVQRQGTSVTPISWQPTIPTMAEGARAS